MDDATLEPAELSRAPWRTSNYSGDGHQCLAVADLADRIAVPNSNEPHAGTMFFTQGQARGLVKAIKGVEFNDLCG